MTPSSRRACHTRTTGAGRALRMRAFACDTRTLQEVGRKSARFSLLVKEVSAQAQGQDRNRKVFDGGTLDTRTRYTHAKPPNLIILFSIYML